MVTIMGISAVLIIIGASLSEPHINGTSMRELYIYILYGTSVTQASYIPLLCCC